MGFTITSTYNTLDLSGSDATYDATAHGVGGLLYIKYTKGNETGVTISFSYKARGLAASDRYSHMSLNASTRIMTPTTYILNASGSYRIPFTWTAEETAVKFTFTQYGVTTATGTIDVDFREAE